MNALRELGIASSSVAYSLADASSLIARYDFAGAVLDFNVKGETTFEFAEKLQARGMPFLFVSGYDTAPDYLVRFPGIALLRKPFRIDELGEAMKKLRHGV
jgi:DNA-binding response OmpR family regulator